MADFRRSKDDMLLGEMYSTLLLETPITYANIERFIKRYYTDPESGEPVTPEHNLREYESCIPFARRYLNDWTPRLQQVVKAAGGNPDIFGYKDIHNLNDVITNAQLSKTEQKKSYKKATGMPLVLETDKYLVFQPENWEASRKYFGAPKRVSLLDKQLKDGARWCTAASTEAQGPRFFHDYVNTNKDRLLYFIRKSDDVLFAYRGYSNDEAWLNQRYKGFIFTLQERFVYDYIKMYHMLPDDPQGLTNKQFFFHETWRGIVDGAAKIASNIVREIRTQSNAAHSGLMDLYADLSGDRAIYQDFMKCAEDYLKFIAFVVYGKTELTGFKQRVSDEELKKDAFSSAEDNYNEYVGHQQSVARQQDEEEEDLRARREEEDIRAWREEDEEEEDLDESYRPSKEELQIEAYKLLLEMPVTAANIERYFKKYLSKEIQEFVKIMKDGHELQHRQFTKRVERGLPVPEDWDTSFDSKDATRRARERYIRGINHDLELWTPKVQQVLRDSGGIADIFGYPTVAAMQEAQRNASLSNTDRKKVYKAALPENIEELWDTPEYTAYKPLTWEASRKYFGEARISILDGESKTGARWCTSASRPDHFNEYVNGNKDRLIYFIRKKDDVLFAARSKRLSGSPNNNFMRFIDMFKAYMGDWKSVGSPSSRNAMQNFIVMTTSLASGYIAKSQWPLYECRNQPNKEINILELYLGVTEGSDSNSNEAIIEGCVEFIKKVVYGM